MVQELTSYPNPWAEILGSVGQGFSKGMVKGADDWRVNRALEDQDISKDPQAYVNALMKSGASDEAIEKNLKGVEMVKGLQKQQRSDSIERDKFDYIKSQDKASNTLKTREQQLNEDKYKSTLDKDVRTEQHQAARDLVADEISRAKLSYDGNINNRKQYEKELDVLGKEANFELKLLHERYPVGVPEDKLMALEENMQYKKQRIANAYSSQPEQQGQSVEGNEPQERSSLEEILNPTEVQQQYQATTPNEELPEVPTDTIKIPERNYGTPKGREKYSKKLATQAYKYKGSPEAFGQAIADSGKGYTNDEIQDAIDTSEDKKSNERSKKQEATEKLIETERFKYVTGMLLEDTTRKNLNNIGLSSDERESLLAEWNPHAAEPVTGILPTTMNAVQKIFDKTGSEEKVRNYLKSRRISPGGTEVILNELGINDESRAKIATEKDTLKQENAQKATLAREKAIDKARLNYMVGNLGIFGTKKKLKNLVDSDMSNKLMSEWEPNAAKYNGSPVIIKPETIEKARDILKKTKSEDKVRKYLSRFREDRVDAVINEITNRPPKNFLNDMIKQNENPLFDGLMDLFGRNNIDERSARTNRRS